MNLLKIRSLEKGPHELKLRSPKRGCCPPVLVSEGVEVGLEHTEADSTSPGKTTNWIQLLPWEDTAAAWVKKYCQEQICGLQGSSPSITNRSTEGWAWS